MKTAIQLLLLVLLTSCANYKNVPYFQNSADYDGAGKGYLYDMTIKPKDELTIFVFSGNNKEAVEKFNFRDPRAIDGEDEQIRTRGGSTIHHYLVDNNGNIEYPTLGQVHVAGLTIDQVNSHIKKLIAPYMQSGADYTVNTYLVNFEVTVMGEVERPYTFTVSRPKVTVLEALAMAGDMTIYGKRDNVKLLRELPDGTYEIHELDLRDANILDSPYYYLQQRDIVYVEPNEVMAQNASIGRTTQLWVRGVRITLQMGSLLYRVLR